MRDKLYQKWEEVGILDLTKSWGKAATDENKVLMVSYFEIVSHIRPVWVHIFNVIPSVKRPANC